MGVGSAKADLPTDNLIGMSGSIENRHLAWIAAWGVVVVVLAGAATTVWVVSAQPHSAFPQWPVYPFAVWAVISLIVMFQPLIRSGLERRNESKLASQQQERSREGVERVRQQGATLRRRQEEESQRWQIATWHALRNDGMGVAIEFHRPDKSDQEAFVGATAMCEVTHSANVYKSKKPVTYDLRAHGSFDTLFPDDFDPAGALDPGDYFVTWMSDVSEGLRKHKFKIDRHGQLEGHGVTLP
jgi:hypothetical protein